MKGGIASADNERESAFYSNTTLNKMYVVCPKSKSTDFPMYELAT